ncbi:PREDICTED: uncharacterized protein LOC109214330 [Nicotiana attenuata]|uniref:uncharacterized protein LOC109214330 n=1 Tax=Nicotiana attenuata TaxID=49451 RepID=UPI0009050E68|nr:PREDICTED: uncharacterized protein LOC109214330 [Nicotiana attenuata]
MMFKSLYWNIRSISSSGAFDRLKQIIRLQNLPFIAISEHFHKVDHLDKFRSMLGYDNAHANIKSQMWTFWNNELNCNVVEDSDQQVTCIIEWMGTNILVTSVYAKCDAGLREHLWNNLRDISLNYKLPWYITGDFNCIIDLSEKQGGNLHRMSKSMPMIQFIMDCDLIDPGFSGSQFTWCNGWSPNRRVWKRLDRVLVNQEWMNIYDSTNVNHLVRTCSDHSPLLTIAKNTSQPTIKYFRFLDFWTNENGFKGGETGLGYRGSWFPYVEIPLKTKKYMQMPIPLD